MLSFTYIACLVYQAIQPSFTDILKPNQTLASLFYHNLFISISHTYISYLHHIPTSHIYFTHPTFPLIFYSCEDLPLLSVEHFTRPATARHLGRFFVICIIGMFTVTNEKLHTFDFICYLNRTTKKIAASSSVFNRKVQLHGRTA
jgi:hypothetical protein